MQAERQTSLSKNLSPLGAWAFSIGTSVGWGSLVVTNSDYLGRGGPLGSVFGLVVGGLVMVLIGLNYAYLMNVYPDAGGAYAFTKAVFGHDYGFLTAWFLTLAYLAVLWANATSVPLFVRIFIGDMFRSVKLYTLFGYDVYLGEALLSEAGLLLACLLCLRWKRVAAGLMTVMAILFSLGITCCFLVGMILGRGLAEPGFLPDSHGLTQVFQVAAISSWAFIGFENISHGGEEFAFPRRLLSRVLMASVVGTTLLYIFMILLSVTAFPPEFGSWLEYIRVVDRLEGIKALPAFYAAYVHLGDLGVGILMGVLLCLVGTSLIGNVTALSRLFYALGKDAVLPRRVGKLNRFGTPGWALVLVLALSVLFPFMGRTAIGWIVDVTTIGATLVYALVSLAAMQLAQGRRDQMEMLWGVLGAAAMAVMGAYLLIPELLGRGAIANESYFLFLVWAVLGVVYFRLLLWQDGKKQFGKSIVVWIALLSLIVFISLVWMNQSIVNAAEVGMRNVERYYIGERLAAVETGVVVRQMELVRRVSTVSVVALLVMFAVSFLTLLNSYHLMKRRMEQSEDRLGTVTRMAFVDALTGVKNHRAYAEKERELDSLIASGNAQGFALVICDVNGLKKINDTKGHRAGDQCIKNASSLICDFFAHSPVYRNGGDEFVVYLCGQDYKNRREILTAFREKAQERVRKGGVVVSAGMSEYIQGRDRSIRTVFDRADSAMYQEKMALRRMEIERK